MPSKPTRRRFLRGAGATAAAALTAPTLLSRRSVDDTLHYAVVGCGARGLDHLWALGYPRPDPTYRIRKRDEIQPLPGVQVVAVCDAFDDNLQEAALAVAERQPEPRRYVDYRRMLDEVDLDVVLVATPDHLHAPIALAAIEAGCDVYVEKCMTNRAEEVDALRKALAEKERLLQVGYQLRQDRIHQMARDIVARGDLGEVHTVQTFMHRNGPGAAWNREIAEGGGPPREKVHWEAFLGDAPAVDYDPHRFFEWRRYWDYSTGIAGDLFSHNLDAVSFVMGGLGVPASAVSSGGIYHWKDGRETPDTWSALLEYPDHDLQLSYNATFSNSFFKRSAMVFCGTEATLEVSWKLQAYVEATSEKYADELADQSIRLGQPFIDVTDSAAGLVMRAGPSSMWLAGKGATATTVDGETRDTTRLHHENFAACVRERRQPDASFESSFAPTVGAHMSTIAYREGRQTRWDPERGVIV